MRSIRLVVAGWLACAPSAWAVRISVTPAAPTPIDTIVLEITGATSCASILPNALEMAGERVIRVHFNDGSNILCFAANPPPRLTIGRLPAGTYAIELVAHNPQPNVVTPAGTITVTSSAGGANDPPPEDYSGHYLTGVAGEGVLVAQFGRTAFVSYLYLGADGKPTWVVMPNAAWGIDSNGSLRFQGSVWRVENQGNAQIGAQTGFGSFHPGGLFFDRAHLSLQVPQTVERELTRFRF